MQVIPLQSTSQVFDVELDGYQVRMEIYYNDYLDRWIVDIENVSLGVSVNGIVMNVTIDLLDAAGTLDLQVLMLINLEGSLAEADVTRLGTDFQLVYMDLETYINAFLNENVIARELFRLTA